MRGAAGPHISESHFKVRFDSREPHSHVRTGSLVWCGVLGEENSASHKWKVEKDRTWWTPSKVLGDPGTLDHTGTTTRLKLSRFKSEN